MFAFDNAVFGGFVLKKFISDFIGFALVGPFLFVGVGQAQASSLVVTKVVAPVVVESRPDRVSAVLAARAQGSRVEVLSSRTESVREWVLPDGSFEVQAYSGPNWVQGSDGSWDELDTTLVDSGDGAFSPAVSALDVVVGGTDANSNLGQSGDLADPSSLVSVSRFGEAGVDVSDKASVTLGWPGDLPTPTVESNMATFADVAPDTDVRVAVIPTGVETFVDIKARPADVPADGVVVDLPLSAKGLTARETSDGGVELVDVHGTVALTTPSARIWDAGINPKSGVSDNEIVVDTTLVKTGTTYVLRVIVPADYFNRQSLVYPVTVDPSYTLQTFGDTFIEKGYDTTDFSGADDLRVGTYDDGTHIARSYLKFTTGTGLSNFATPTTVVTAANLHLYEWHSSSCTARQIDSHRAMSPWYVSSLTWATRTSYNSTADGSEVEAHGYSSSCPDAWLNGSTGISVKGTVAAWAKNNYVGGAPNYGIVLDASNEADSLSWKRFYSGEYATTSKRPFLTFSYVHRPATPSTPTITPLNKVGTTYFTNSAHPDVVTSLSDLDGGNLHATYQVFTAAGTTVGAPFDSAVQVGNGATASTSVPSTITLTEGQTYKIRATGKDDTYASASYTTDSTSPVTTPAYRDSINFVVDTQPPTLTSISCQGIKLNGVVAIAASTVTCTATTPTSDSTIASKSFTVDNETPVLAASGSSSVTVPSSQLTPGRHELTVVVTDMAGNSETKVFWFAIGPSALASPHDGDVSAGDFALELRGPAGASSATFEYSSNGGQTYSPITQLVKADGTTWSAPSPLPVDVNTEIVLTGITWRSGLESQIGSSRDVLIRGCLSGYSTGLYCGTRSVTRWVHAFGASQSTASIGVGDVSLLTGEVRIGATDAYVDAGSTSFSVSRTWLGFADVYPAADPNDFNDVSNQYFGPGWAGDFPETLDSGFQNATVADQAASSGAVTFTQDDGSLYSFKCTAMCTQQSSSATTFVAEGDASNAGLTLTHGLYPGSTTAMPIYALVLSDASGVSTKWRLSAGKWIKPMVSDPTSSVDVVTDSGVRTNAPLDGMTFTGDDYYIISAPAQTNLACNPPSSGSAASFEPTIGCTALGYIIANASTPVPTGVATGDFPGRVKAVVATTFDSSALNGMGEGTNQTKIISRYAYNAEGYLVAQWDPREATSAGQLVTQYGYDTAQPVHHLTSITPASVLSHPLAATVLTYDSSNRLHTFGDVGAGVSTVVYSDSVPTGPSYPQMNSATVAAWGQSSVPVKATAIVDSGMSTTDPRQSSLTYMDVTGRTLNTAVFGADQWLIDAQQFDDLGRVAWTLSASNRARALMTAGSADDPRGLPTGDSVVRAELLRSQTLFMHTDPTRVATQIGPLSDVTLDDGSLVSARSYSHTSYDDEPGIATQYSIPATATDASGATLSAPWKVPVVETSAVIVADTSGTVVIDGRNYAIADTSTIINDYNPINTGDGSGWILGSPSQVTIKDVTAGHDVTTITRYNKWGQIVETRQPKATATSAGTTQYVYYTAAGSGSPSTSGCGQTPEWEGLLCMVKPASQPAGTTIPTTTTTNYDPWRQPLVTSEVSNSRGRTTTRINDAAGRQLSSTLEWYTIQGGTPQTSGKQTSVTTMTYWPETGLLKDVTANGSTVTTTYDGLGRVVSQTDGSAASAATSTTTYDQYGRVSATTDGLSTTTYSYATTDMLGHVDYRGLVTSKTVAGALPTSVSANGQATFSGAYDLDGGLAQETYPSGLTVTYTSDTIGRDTALVYSNVLNPSLMSQRRTYNSSGQVVTDTSDVSDASYSYDGMGRLVHSERTISSSCTVKNYTFDDNSNRTALDTWTAGTCPATAADADVVTTAPRTFDTADRATLAGYTYDEFGRTKTVPAADTANGVGLTISYRNDDQVQSITEGTKTTSFTPDALGRLAKTNEYDATVLTGSTINHYDDTSDSPAWSQNPATVVNGVDATSWKRMLTSLSGDAVINTSGTTTATGTTVSTATGNISDMHGDTIATIDLTPGTQSVSSTSAYDEYGAPIQTPDLTQPGKYGWIGTKSRLASLGGIVLMGVRLYNPTSGRFLQVDPIRGGNANAYSYPTDPILGFDLDGKFGWNSIGKFIDKHGDSIALGLALVGIAACAATMGVGCTLASALTYGFSYANDYVKARKTMSTKSAIKHATSNLGVGLLFGKATSLYKARYFLKKMGVVTKGMSKKQMKMAIKAWYKSQDIRIARTIETSWNVTYEIGNASQGGR